MLNEEKELIAHLIRRAGFGATKSEIESLASLEYKQIVDSLISPSDTDSLPDDLIRRYHVDQNEMRLINHTNFNKVINVHIQNIFCQKIVSLPTT